MTSTGQGTRGTRLSGPAIVIVISLVAMGGNRPFAADAKETKDFPKAVIYFQTSDSKPN